MSIYVKCEGCGKILNVPDGCEGRTVQCATCNKRMRVPKPASHTPAEAAQSGTAPAAPAPAAPASEGAANDQADFFRALAEEAARERGGAEAAKAAKAEAEAELTPLSEGLTGSQSSAVENLEIQMTADEPGNAAVESPAPPTPAAPRPAAPAGAGMPDDKDALFNALAEEAAREQRETEAAKAAQAAAAAALPPSPEALARNQSAAAKELRIKTVADKSGYAIADVPEPPAPQETRRRSVRKYAGVAAGLLLLVVLIVISINVGLSSSKGAVKAAPKEKSVIYSPTVSPPAAPGTTSPELPPALKEAAQAIGDKACVEVEVVESAAEAAVQPMPMLTPAGDLLLDVANLHIRDKSGADASFQEMRSAVQAAVRESVAAGLREKGLTAAQAGESAAGNPGEARSRLKIFIAAAPAWAGFSLRESGIPGTENMPLRPVPPRPGTSPRNMHHTQFAPSRASPPPAVPVKLWERLLSGGLTLNARFGPDAPQLWQALPTDDAHADLLPCGLRISIVRVVWEVGGRTFGLVGSPAETDSTPSISDAAAGLALPFHRPKDIREIQLAGQMGPDRTCLVSGFCQYNDVDLHGNAAEAGKPMAGLLATPEADWNTLWDGKAGKDSLAAACRNILRLEGGPAIVEALAAKPDRLPQSSTDALASVLRDEHSSPEWAMPFLAVRGPCGDAAMICLARRPKEENQKDFLQWVAAPADHSPASVQAACCALIDLARPDLKAIALIDTRAVKAFSEVRSPRGSLAFPPQTAQTVLDWLIRNGTSSQKIGAAAAAVEGNLSSLQEPVLDFVAQSLGSEPEALCSLCAGIEKARSPLAFEVLKCLAQHQLMQSDAGDRFQPPAALSTAGRSLPPGRFSRTVAALVCAGLARYDKFEAGDVLAGLIQSPGPGPATRYCAIETLIALDDVDVTPKIRERFEVLSKQPRDEYEAQEWELLNPAKNPLCRYYVPLIIADTALKNGMNLKEVIETCDGIIRDNPSPKLVERARKMKSQAEKLLAPKAGTPH